MSQHVPFQQPELCRTCNGLGHIPHRLPGTATTETCPCCLGAKLFYPSGKPSEPDQPTLEQLTYEMGCCPWRLDISYGCPCDKGKGTWWVAYCDAHTRKEICCAAEKDLRTALLGLRDKAAAFRQPPEQPAREWKPQVGERVRSRGLSLQSGVVVSREEYLGAGGQFKLQHPDLTTIRNDAGKYYALYTEYLEPLPPDPAPWDAQDIADLGPVLPPDPAPAGPCANCGGRYTHAEHTAALDAAIAAARVAALNDAAAVCERINADNLAFYGDAPNSYSKGALGAMGLAATRIRALAQAGEAGK